MLLTLTLTLTGLALAASPSFADLQPRDADGDGTTDVAIPADQAPGWARIGLGAPAVTWDGSQWVMLFESRFTEEALDSLGSDFDDCRSREGRDSVVFGIGRATSPDGRTWSVDEAPFLVPGIDPWASCGVMDPVILRSVRGWVVLARSWQAQERALPSGGTEYGERQETGVTSVQTLDLRTALAEDGRLSLADPALFDLVGATQLDTAEGALYWLISRSGDSLRATQATDERDFVDTFEIDRGADMPLDSLYGDEPYHVEILQLGAQGGYLTGVSPGEETTVLAGAGPVGWMAQVGLREADLLRLGDDYVMYYVTPDAGGGTRVHIADTLGDRPMDPSTLRDRPAWTEDGQEPGDTDTDLPDTDAPDTGTGADTDVSPKGCGCTAVPPGGAGAFWLVAVGLGWVRRRSRVKG